MSCMGSLDRGLSNFPSVDAPPPCAKSANRSNHRNVTSPYVNVADLDVLVFQNSLLNYFLLSREENFFAAIRNRMHMSALAIKER